MFGNKFPNVEIRSDESIEMSLAVETLETKGQNVVRPAP